MDQGGTWSDSDVTTVNVSDDSTVPIISMNGMVLTDNLSILTGQIIQFSAEQTTDNVPVSHLDFTWDWGDGSLEGGKGVTRAYHMWEDGLTAVTTYNTLTVSDGVNSASEIIEIIVNNRAPGQIFTDIV